MTQLALVMVPFRLSSATKQVGADSPLQFGMFALL